MQAPKPYREERPWGEFIEFTRNTPSTVKIITVKAGEAFSLQTHSARDEFWRIISGDGTITIGTKATPISPGSDYFVPRGTAHRIEAHNSSVVVLEISFGMFDEKDITRIEDKYGRTT
jgi:mannose-6-phosphate isomerase-like protein (cupin superfamily)